MKFQTTISHPWHGIKSGDRAPEYVNAVIEIPRGSRVKYELDKQSGLLSVDRILHADITYPCNYGFIPSTYADDNDPLDILVLCSLPIKPLSLTQVRVIGGLAMVDQEKKDDKIIAVLPTDPAMASVYTLSDLLDFERESIRTFFSTYKIPEAKITNVHDFMSVEQAHETIMKSIKAYQEEIAKPTSFMHF